MAASTNADVASPDWTQEQFEMLYHTHGPAIWRYVLRMTGDPDLANDILQETFIRMLQRRPPAMEPRALRVYLFQTAIRLVYDEWRKQKRVRRLWERLRHRITAKREHAGVTRRDLEKCLQQLSVKERTLLWLAYVEGWSHREIAQALGLQEKSVRVLLFRARKKVQSALA